MVALLTSPADSKSLSPRAESRTSNVVEQARSSLRSSPYSWLRTVSCDYRDSVLILRGAVPSYYLKQLAQERVAHLDGVDRIENQIEVKRCRN